MCAYQSLMTVSLQELDSTFQDFLEPLHAFHGFQLV